MSNVRNLNIETINNNMNNNTNINMNTINSNENSAIKT